MDSIALERSPKPALTFDRQTGRIGGAGVRERLTIGAMQAGAAISSAWYFRGFAAGCQGLRVLSAEQPIEVRLNEDAIFSFPFCDGYWSLLLFSSYRYEFDIEMFFKGIADADYTLIDGGANFGYWSVLASSRPYGAHRSIAIEPSSANFTWLSRNASRNGGRFTPVKAAIGATEGVAHLSGRKHEALSIAGGSDAGEEVPVVTLDSLMERMKLDPKGRYVAKLDVEGVEIAAIAGGEKLLSGDCVMICEEHGNDRNHTISRHILDHTPFKLFCYDPATGRFEQLTDVSPLDRIKRAVNYGYNVLATASPYWEQRIRALGPFSRER
ncbi:FkbM family methyltransferase [[Pseudomonas] carboxydohydrogena]|uniref:FkbM family methyltransferase n=1 Tax=Afipia carboxydohydrogena TaxID=290 RepID=A0ABY8BVY0_AFICR|nr:FkbM family methyltransferase [[Pseudomonas] carboxydohydrogena]WEF52815.1 FkbM family methyltransferase [[Pseudomonas] carboxydohydrogena]